jgi:prephenate dehydrogenase
MRQEEDGVVNNAEIGIIGGTGGIGKWFAGFFQGQGFTVHVSGRTSGMAAPDMAGTCAVVIVSVPIGATLDVIRGVGPHMKAGSLLMDLTSLKRDPVQAMLDSSPSEVIGLHPLFGPDAPSLSGQNIVICPARTEKWLLWLKDILEKNGARLIEASPVRHDKIMAVVQGLTHLNTMTLGIALRETGLSPEELERFSTPVSRLKGTLIEKVFEKNPRLYAEIVASNPHVPGMLRLYEKALARLKAPIKEGDAEELEKLLLSKR